MTKKYLLRLRIALLLLLVLTLGLTGFGTGITLAAPNFDNQSFRSVWSYSDGPVENGTPNLGRGYTWGPTSIAIKTENYREAPGGTRPVQYFDKARMESTQPAQNEYDITNVTNGLLTVELATGRRQDGDNTFTTLLPSDLSVAGDALDPNNPSPRYAAFGEEVMTINPALPVRSGQVINTGRDLRGRIGPVTPPVQTTYSYYDPTTHHNVADVFYRFMYQKGIVSSGARGMDVTAFVYTANPLIFVFGLPVSEAYWIRATVGGVDKDVLVQLFQRRILTYTPSNPDPYKVEMGNIGQHYYQWRYGKAASAGDPATAGPGPIIGGKAVLARDNGNIELYSSLQGGSLTKIAVGTSPIFSPDMQRVAFIGDSNGELSNLIQSVNLDGTGKRNHCTVSGKYLYTLVRWSDDAIMVGVQTVGSHLLLRCYIPTGQLMDLGTLNFHEFLPVYDYSRSYSAFIWEMTDGPDRPSRIYYGSSAFSSFGQAITTGQHTINSSTKYYNDATLSPDGKTIAVAGDAVFLVSVPGQNSPLAGKIFFQGLSPSRLAWSSDGSELVAVVAGPNGNDLKELKVATGQVVGGTDGVNWVDWAR